MNEITTDPIALRKRTMLCILTVLVVIILDQWLKIWVKTNMEYGSEFKILGLQWARIHFVENEGMAFGISLGGNMGKLFLSVFRILAVGFLIYILIRLIRSRENWGLLVCFSLILAGAVGNILDSAFYGLMFTESYYQGGIAEYAPHKGYAPFLFGRVVDMLYFPMIDTRWPSWMPLVGGDPFQFFRPVFNVADAAISTGVISLIVFFRSFFKSSSETTKLGNTLEVQSPVQTTVTETLRPPDDIQS
jgi:signal peptidase II